MATFKPNEPNHRTLALMEAANIQFVTYFDPQYPLMLKGLADPPALLFYRGSLSCLHKPCLAIVGSRKATNYGLQLTRKLSAELSRLGFVIVSGLALGIDGAAHQACLETRGQTVGILGSGLDRIYPKSHQSLAEAMVEEDSLLVSEWPPDCPPKPFHFPIRNRLISGLSHGVLVIEAAKRSGSLITAKHALEQGKHVFALPGRITEEMAQGPNGLIARGEAQLFESCQTILENLAPLIKLAGSHARLKAEIIKDPLARKIYDTLDAFEPTSLDLITTKLGVSAPLITAQLVALESRNLVTRQPGPVYFRNPLQTLAQE